MPMRHLTRPLAVLLPAVLLLAAEPAAAPPRPRLIVLIAVDQMRADYVDRFQHQWRGGLRRLVDQGAVFRQASYSYFGTLTCAGHATLSTGSIPATHGMVLDGWWDRESARRLACTHQPDAKAIRYGTAGRGGNGPAPLLVPTLADELRAQLAPPAKIVSFALKARAAVVLAGRKADAVAWFDEGDAWVTSTAYTPTPVPFVADFVKANPVEADLGKVWTPTIPAGARLYQASVGTDGAAFSYPIRGDGAALDTKFYTAWKTSPLADEYVIRLSSAAVDRLGLGRGPGTDLLAIGLSAADYVGHEYGPRSLEVQDHFVRIDAALGRLLDQLDRTVGRNQYVVALSADHGVAPIPEWATEEGFDAGRISREDVVASVNKALEPTLGPGKHAIALNHTELYFAAGVYEKIRANPDAMKAVLETLNAVPGVARVFRSEDLSPLRVSDPLARLVHRSYFPGRSGDLVVIPKPYWYTWNRGADHGTGYQYDTRVPLIISGPGVRAGEYLQPADPADLAPTLAFLAGVTLPSPDGRVLVEALSPDPEGLGIPTSAGSRP
jgi:predicted AlkP superfamily pyrophosphatase or phosphodiesterase